MRLLGTPCPERVAGSDLLPEVNTEAASRGLTVIFMGILLGAAPKAAAKLADRFLDSEWWLPTKHQGRVRPQPGFR